MAETRVLTPLLRLVDDAGGKAILVGDPGQLPAVGAGGLFPALCEQLGAIGLSENRRQHDPAERDALARLRSGDPEPYLAHAASSGRLHLEDDAASAKSRLLDDWWQAANGDIDGSVMLAYRRDDVRELNDAAHVLMLNAGRLGPDALQLSRREFRVGDRAICRRNDARCDVRNGTRGSVVEVNSTTQALMLRTDAGALRRIDAHYAVEHLDHAYALTGHAAQGATVDRAFVLLGDEGALREWGYVACSRARNETRLYLAADPLEREHDLRPLNRPEPSVGLARALAQSAEEKLAFVQARAAVPSDATRRALEQSRRSSERALELAEQRLAAAEQKLRGLGRFGHRQHRAELQAEAALQRTVVKMARTQLALRVEQPESRPARSVRARREPPQLVLTRNRERDHDLGLGL